MDRVIVAYSGGTDSAYLAWAAHQVLGARAVAITADSASIPASHKRDAEDFVQQFRHPARVHRNPRIRESGLHQERRQPLLPLQGRAVHAPGRSGAAARDSEHHLRRESGRSGRLPARPERRATASREGSAGGSRTDQSRKSASFRAWPGCPHGTVPPLPASVRAFLTARRSRSRTSRPWKSAKRR